MVALYMYMQKVYERRTTSIFPRQSAKLSNGSDWTCTFILFRYNNRRAKRAGKFFNAHTKMTPDNAENLEMLFSEIYILKIPGGSRPPTPRPPPPPLDPRLSPRGGGLRQKIILTEGQQGEHHSACYLGIELGFGVFWPMVCTLPAVFVFVFLLLMDIFYIDCSSHVYSSASVNLIKI